MSAGEGPSATDDALQVGRRVAHELLGELRVWRQLCREVVAVADAPEEPPKPDPFAEISDPEIDLTGDRPREPGRHTDDDAQPRAGEGEGAVSEIEEIDNRVIGIWWELGQKWDARGDREMARKYYDKIVRYYPNSARGAEAQERLDALREQERRERGLDEKKKEEEGGSGE